MEQEASDPDRSFGTDLAQDRDGRRGLVNMDFIKCGECLD